MHSTLPDSRPEWPAYAHIHSNQCCNGLTTVLLYPSRCYYTSSSFFAILMFSSDSGKANVAASVLCTTGSLDSLAGQAFNGHCEWAPGGGWDSESDSESDSGAAVGL